MKATKWAPLIFAVSTAIGLFGCQSAPPLSRETFSEAANRCELTATTYTFRDGIFLDEPLIDFTREQPPSNAHECFNEALEQIDREKTKKGVEHISYIWEWRA